MSSIWTVYILIQRYIYFILLTKVAHNARLTSRGVEEEMVGHDGADGGIFRLRWGVHEPSEESVELPRLVEVERLVERGADGL